MKVFAVENDATYPWKVGEGGLVAGNSGVPSSNSYLKFTALQDVEVTFTYAISTEYLSG